MATSSEFFNLLTDIEEKVRGRVNPQLQAQRTRQLFDCILSGIATKEEMWHPKHSTMKGYSRRLQESWNDLFDSVPTFGREFTIYFKNTAADAFYKDRETFYKQLIEKQLGSNPENMMGTKQYSFLKKGAPKKYSELIDILRREEKAMKKLKESDSQDTSPASSLNSETPVKEEATIKPRKSKLSEGRAPSQSSEQDEKPKTKATKPVPGAVQRVTVLPKSSENVSSSNIDQEETEDKDQRVRRVLTGEAPEPDVQHLLDNPLCPSEQQVQHMVFAECSRALEEVKSQRIPFVPNYATTEYFQKRVSHHAKQLYEEIILWNKYQAMQNKSKRLEIFEETSKSLEVRSFPVVDVEQIVKGVPEEDESKQLPKANACSVVQTTEMQKISQNRIIIPANQEADIYDFVNFGFDQIGASVKNFGKKCSDLTAALSEPAKAVAQMTLDMMEAELNAQEVTIEKVVETVNPTIDTIEHEYRPIRSEIWKPITHEDLVDAQTGPEDLNISMRTAIELEDEDQIDKIRGFEPSDDFLGEIRKLVEGAPAIEVEAALRELAGDIDGAFKETLSEPSLVREPAFEFSVPKIESNLENNLKLDEEVVIGMITASKTSTASKKIKPETAKIQNKFVKSLLGSKKVSVTTTEVLEPSLTHRKTKVEVKQDSAISKTSSAEKGNVTAKLGATAVKPTLRVEPLKIPTKSAEVQAINPRQQFMISIVSLYIMTFIMMYFKFF